MKKGFMESSRCKPLYDDSSSSSDTCGRTMKLGVRKRTCRLASLNRAPQVAYNVYDGEELLLDSIRSIKSNVDYICVVYQTVTRLMRPSSVS